MMQDVIFARTRTGTLALNNASFVLSAGFRQLLSLIDGKRKGSVLMEGLPHLDEEDLALWTGELARLGLIARQGEVPVDEMAFSMTTEMPSEHGNTVDASALIDDIMSDVSHSIAATPDAAVKKRLSSTARMAAIESLSSFDSLEQSGYFVYPQSAEGLPARPLVCIVGHLPAQNKLLELVLRRAGAETSTAATRAAMRNALQAEAKPNIMLIDAEMPMLDAARTLDAMRIDPALQPIRVVLVSERGARADLAHAIMLGAAGYIVKPLRKDMLDAAIPRITGLALT